MGWKRFGSWGAVAVVWLSLAACGSGSEGDAGEVEQPPPNGDATSPTVRIGLPTSGSSYATTSGSVNLSGSATDNVGVTRVSWVNDRGGSGNASMSGTTAASWTVSALALQSGTNNLTVTARDAVGNTATTALAVNYSTTSSPPPAGSTYYVDTNASDDSGDGSSARPKKYITSGAALMSSAGGSTLIIRAGTYGNAKDAVGSLTAGKAGAWNVIKAEVDDSVIITAGMNLGQGDHYLQFEGLRWDSQNQKNINGRYVKVLRSSFKGGPTIDNVVQLAIGTNDATPGAQYILLEDTYVYGPGGRYNLLVYNADKIVLRRVLARHQDGWTDSNGDPQAVVSLYNSTDVLTQNLMILDSGTTGYFEAALYHPSNSRPSSNIQNTGAIILNTRNGSAVAWDDSGGSTGNLLQDSVIWGAPYAVSINGAAHAGTINRTTVGATSTGGINDFGSGRGFSVTNSVLWQLSGLNLSAISHSNNDCYTPACSGEISLNPAVSGLVWLTKIETSSLLATLGLSGGRVGATVIKKLGTSGTLWGESGYNQATGDNLWPWPNEAGIKKAMCTDVGVTTGFCAKPSITQYVWTYLGTAAPSSYGP